MSVVPLGGRKGVSEWSGAGGGRGGGGGVGWGFAVGGAVVRMAGFGAVGGEGGGGTTIVTGTTGAVRTVGVTTAQWPWARRRRFCRL